MADVFVLHLVQGSDLKDTGVMTRVGVRFVIEPSVVLYLSLWEDVVSMFRGGVINSGDKTKTVMLVTTVNPKIFGEQHEAEFICKARFVEVLQQNGWSYVCYTTCSKKLHRSGPSLYCNQCVDRNVTGDVK
ncbi:unnamed protein product [Eruca vesicaria subsp. sativa]|uniref:Uncharacterized protein n=1 Tax=Eruca vesicaria subsp. sativa TaxID=29727 RepID=A0ABC8L3F5_ERUVS|nr:unnamed protein product [Eruca vesicaria subsp. sativa]